MGIALTIEMQQVPVSNSFFYNFYEQKEKLMVPF